MSLAYLSTSGAPEQEPVRRRVLSPATWPRGLRRQASEKLARKSAPRLPTIAERRRLRGEAYVINEERLYRRGSHRRPERPFLSASGRIRWAERLIRGAVLEIQLPGAQKIVSVQLLTPSGSPALSLERKSQCVSDPLFPAPLTAQSLPHQAEAESKAGAQPVSEGAPLVPPGIMAAQRRARWAPGPA